MQFLVAVYTSIPVADKRSTPCGYAILRLRMCICVCLCMYPCTRDVCVFVCTYVLMLAHACLFKMQVRNIYVYLIFMSTCRWKRLCRFELMRSLIRFTKYYVCRARFERRSQLQKLHTVGNRWMNENGVLVKYWQKKGESTEKTCKPVHCHFDYHKSNMDWRGRKQGSLGWQADC